MAAPKILLVEDQELLRRSLTKLLQRRGFLVESSPQGVDALRRLEGAARATEPFDLLLSDVRMPDMDGLTLLREVRGRYAELPVILVTAFGERGVLREALRLRCDGFIDKPCTAQEVVQAIHETLRHVRTRDRPHSEEGQAGRGRRIGKFELGSELARGATGVIYRARQLDLDRPVALKVLETPDLESERAELRHEARAMAQLDHPNVARVFEVGRQSGIDYIAMELVEGRSLLALLREEGRLSAWQATRILLPVARALEHAHARGVLHHDLKPGNVVIHRSGRPVLVDFGLANVRGELNPDEGEGCLVGTAHYLPRDYLAGEPYRAESEVYVLGVLLYECLAGPNRYPHGDGWELPRGIDLVALLHDRIHEPLRPLSEVIEVDPELEAIVSDALEARIRTTQELANRLEAWSRCYAERGEAALAGGAQPLSEEDPTIALRLA